MVIELCGVPGGGKSTLVKRYVDARPRTKLIALSMQHRAPTALYAGLFALSHPLAFAAIVLFVIRYHMQGLFWYSLHLALRACAKHVKARFVLGREEVLIDEGLVHLLCVIPARPLTDSEMGQWLSRIPHPDAIVISTEGTFHRFHSAEAAKHPRVQKGATALAAWEEAVRANASTLRACLDELQIPAYSLEHDALPHVVQTTGKAWRRPIIIGSFALVALVGLVMSYAAPYVKSDDELVYLTGALQVREGNLPDAPMLKGYDYGPYLYPRVMAVWYEQLGYDTFKSGLLIALIFAIGIAAYATFRLLWLPWVPALLLSVIALIPRVSAGTEFFGVLTFHEVVGRSLPLPLFFLATAILIRRVADHKPLWPVFGIIGLLLFLHPVTVMLFAFVSLCTILVVLLWMRTPVLRAVRTVIISGLTFMAAGSYFFVDLLLRLGHGVAVESVQSAAYVQAVVFRNTWEFPAASLDWYRHMAIVSGFFLALIAAFYLIPFLRRVRARHTFPNTKLLMWWGGTLAIFSLGITLLFPGANLYFMQHADAPYIFQQWSRTSKFYYLGLFIMVIPTAYVLWGWYRKSANKWKHAALALVVLGGVMSSSVAFEATQFAIGYPHYERAYVPQALSHIPDDVRAEDYREMCALLSALGAGPEDQILSPDFALRYYCRADLYTTNEEGGAYTQFARSEMVAWHQGLLAQRAALTSRDPDQVRAFARNVGASYAVLPQNAQYTPLMAYGGWEIATTTHFIIIKLAP